MTAFGASFLQFPNEPDPLSRDLCYPYLLELAPLVIHYLTEQDLLRTVYDKTIAELVVLTRQAVQKTGSTVTVKSGKILTRALSPIVAKLNESFQAIKGRVLCAAQPVLCSAVSGFSQIIPIKMWRINLIRAPQNPY